MRSSLEDTVAAIATPHGKGALSVIRLSGRDAFPIGLGRTGLRQDAGAARRLRHSRFLDSNGRSVDEVLVAFFPGPHSYTGEDVVEISCHGSPVVSARILQECLRAGARLADPGEFTLRAFANGKMDLSQAEAVRDLIESQTEFQAQLALEQVRGSLSRELAAVRESLIEAMCQMETRLEFVEDDIEPESRETLLRELGRTVQQLRRLEGSFAAGKIVHDGVKIVLSGKPNTGKSSIFNALGRYERAIVSEFPGTTRDFLTEVLDIHGIPVELIDTAGIREVEEGIERAGVDRALDQLERADLVLFVLDGSQPFDSEDERISQQLRKMRKLLVVNKVDLPRLLDIPEDLRGDALAVVEVSALKKTNLQQLSEALVNGCVDRRTFDEEGAMVTNVRHKHCLERARESVSKAEAALAGGLSEEYPLYDLRKALDALADLTGETTSGELLEQIFATFCIGK